MQLSLNVPLSILVMSGTLLSILYNPAINIVYKYTNLSSRASSTSNYAMRQSPT